MPDEDRKLDPAGINKLWATAQSMFVAESAMRIIMGVPGGIVGWYVMPPEGTVQIVILGVAAFLVLNALHASVKKAWDVWTARPAYRFKAMADHAESLAEKFARCNMVWNRATSAVQDMIKLRDDLAPLRVHIPVESVALANHPILVGDVCEANEKTLRPLAELMHAGDLKTARAEFPKVPAP